MQNEIENLIPIGDIHGKYKKLNALLKNIEQKNLPNSLLVFVGDLIDNNLTEKNIDHIKTIDKVMALVKANKAICLLGNHEFNAIGWSLIKADGTFARDRNKFSNAAGHKAFLRDVISESSIHKKYIKWFKSLPLFFEEKNVKVIHACWNDELINRLKPYLNQDNSLQSKYWFDAFDKDHELYYLIEILLKGPETILPKMLWYNDKNGIPRKSSRVAWWIPKNEVRDLSCLVQPFASLIIPKEKVNDEVLKYNTPTSSKIVVGHYALKYDKQPLTLRDNIACVDFGAYSAEKPLIGLIINLANESCTFVDDEFILSN